MLSFSSLSLVCSQMRYEELHFTWNPGTRSVDTCLMTSKEMWERQKECVEQPQKSIETYGRASDLFQPYKKLVLW